MEGSGDLKMSLTRSTDTGVTCLSTPRREVRAAALRFLAGTLLSESEEEVEEENLCTDILSTFINTLEDRHWDTLRDRMRQPLTQAHLAQVSRKIIKVVSELVFQMLVPALIVHLQGNSADDSSESSSDKSSKSHSHDEEETQSKGSRSSLVMVRPYVEEPLSGVNEGSLANPSDSSASQSSGSTMQGEDVQQVHQGPPVLAACTPPREHSATRKSSSSASDTLEMLTEELILIIIICLDKCQEKTGAGTSTESSARKILKQLAIEMKSAKWANKETGHRRLEKFDQDSLDGFEMGPFCICWNCHERPQSCTDVFQWDETPCETNPESGDGPPLQSMAITYSMTVSSLEVMKELSSQRFRCACLLELEEFLIRSQILLSSQSSGAAPCEPWAVSVYPVASEVLETVVNRVNQLCQSQPTKFTLPWQRSENTTVPEDKIISTAWELKLCLQFIMQNFFKFHTMALDNLREEGEVERAAPRSSSSDETPEDTQEGSVMPSSHSAATSSREGLADAMANIVRSFLDETEQLLKQNSSVQSADAAMRWLEELISKDKLVNFTVMLTDKFISMLQQHEPSPAKLLAPNRRAWSDPELSQLTTRPAGSVLPSEQVCLFVEEAVKHLLMTLFFPPPSWGMGHMIQVQSGASSAADWAESDRKYEAVIGDYSKLMADQVKGRLSRMSAASLGVDNGDQRPKTWRNIIHFFQELPNKIRLKFRTWTNNEV